MNSNTRSCIGTCESLEAAACTWKSPEIQPWVSTTWRSRACTTAPLGVTRTTPSGRRRRMPRLYRGGGAFVAEERLQRRHVERLAEHGVDVAGRRGRLFPAGDQRQLQPRLELPQAARQLQPVHLRHGEV